MTEWAPWVICEGCGFAYQRGRPEWTFCLACSLDAGGERMDLSTLDLTRPWEVCDTPEAEDAAFALAQSLIDAGAAEWAGPTPALCRFQRHREFDRLSPDGCRLICGVCHPSAERTP